MAIPSSRRRTDATDAEKAIIPAARAESATTAEEEEAALDLSALQALLHPAMDQLPRTPRQARSREKRAELLKSAETLFVERGYAATTADDIAIAAGVSVGTFYNYFRNKRQILMALTLLRLSDIFTHLRLAEMDLAHGEHHAAIHAAITSVLVDEQRPGLRLVWQQMMSLEPELAPYQAIVRRYALERIAERLREACECGDVWPDLDIEGSSLAILSMLDNLSARRDDELPVERIIDAVTTLIERALFPPSTMLTAERGGSGAESGGEGGAP